MDFALTPDQESLRSSVRDFLAKECTSAVVRKACESDEPFDAALWRKAADLGWPALCVPEEYGGVGLGWIETALLAEEMGRALFPGPYFSTLLAATAILAGGNVETKKKYLPGLADGSLIGAVALFEGRGDRPEDIRMKARPSGNGYILDGVKLFVTDGNAADVMVVAALGEDGLTFLVVDGAAKGVVAEALPVVDRTRPQASVTFSEVEVPAANLLEGETFELIRDRAALFLAAEQTGVARRCMEMSIEYAKTRQQFGKPIGIYQAVSHKLSDMYMMVEHATSLVLFAAWAADEDPDSSSAAAWRAKVWASRAARAATGDGIQVHGGIGFTWEHDLHLYFKRAKANEFLISDSTRLRELIADRIAG